MKEFVKVAKVSDLPEGEMMAVEVEGEQVLLVNAGGRFYALGEVCPHAGAPLSEGFLEDDSVECPWHASRFKLDTGEVLAPPAETGVPAYAVRVEGDDILVGPA